MRRHSNASGRSGSIGEVAAGGRVFEGGFSGGSFCGPRKSIPHGRAVTQRVRSRLHGEEGKAVGVCVKCIF